MTGGAGFFAGSILLAGCRDGFPSAAPAPLEAFPGNVDPPMLIDASTLRAELTQPNARLRILDLSPPRTYRRGHIPGAIHAWWQDTMEWNRPIYGTVLRPDEEQRARTGLLQDLGIDDSIRVVVYDDDQNRWAARMLWFLRFLGHDAVAILDGGLAAWRGAGGDLDDGEDAAPNLSTPTVVPREGYYVTTDQLIPLLDDDRTRLVDTRDFDEIHDDVNGTLPIGRIPGARWVPWTATLRDAAGRLQTVAALRKLYLDQGISREHRVVVYARFGVEGAHSWYVLKMLGYPEVLVYDWGWADWSTRPDLTLEPLPDD
jgi:thiosulfate/3-mercaptopyruvate sulfurtransferase